MNKLEHKKIWLEAQLALVHELSGTPSMTERMELDQKGRDEQGIIEKPRRMPVVKAKSVRKPVAFKVRLQRTLDIFEDLKPGEFIQPHDLARRMDIGYRTGTYIKLLSALKEKVVLIRPHGYQLRNDIPKSNMASSAHQKSSPVQVSHAERAALIISLLQSLDHGIYIQGKAIAEQVGMGYSGNFYTVIKLIRDQIEHVRHRGYRLKSQAEIVAKPMTVVPPIATPPQSKPKAATRQQRTPKNETPIIHTRRLIVARFLNASGPKNFQCLAQQTGIMNNSLENALQFDWFKFINSEYQLTESGRAALQSQHEESR
jgi:hypothetical protein